MFSDVVINDFQRGCISHWNAAVIRTNECGATPRSMTLERDRYQSGVLTAIAVLLGVLVWAQVSGQPQFAASAQAQIRSKPVGTARASASGEDQRHLIEGVSSVGRRSIEQRNEIIAVITALQDSVNRLADMVASGDVRVQVTEQRDTKQDQQAKGESK